MSVEYEPKLTVGWRVKQREIPDFDERYDEAFAELGDLAMRASEVLHKAVWTDSLCEEEDSWCGDTQIIGVPMYDRELRMDELVGVMNQLAVLAEEVYGKVMRREPEDGPYLISWTQVR